MNWRDILHRTNLALGLISLVVALWAGVHLQHLLDDAGSRHSGETIVAIVLALLVFAASRYGARPGTTR
jgi:predicted membrane-bound spermidine synthase